MPAATPFRFAELAPDPRLSPWIWCYWEFTVGVDAPALHHVPPDGCTSLLVSMIPNRTPVALVSGPWSEPLPVPVEPGSRYVGVRFNCGGGAVLLGIEPAALLNRVQPAADLLGETAEKLTSEVAATSSLSQAAEVMDRLLGPIAERCPPPDELVCCAVAAIVASRGRSSIAMIAIELGTSERTLLRHFRRATALTPKLFARIQRLRFAAMELVEQRPSLSRVAAEGGYADQPHLTHDFVNLLGLTPGEMARVIDSTSHEGFST